MKRKVFINNVNNVNLYGSEGDDINTLDCTCDDGGDQGGGGSTSVVASVASIGTSLGSPAAGELVIAVVGQTIDD